MIDKSLPKRITMVYVLIFALLLLALFFWEKGHRVTRPMPGGLHLDISLPFEREFELYHNDLSLCSKKARVCLAELRIPYKAHHIDLIETGSYETISRHFLKVNPAGILPVLVHNGHPVYESHDIISYLAQKAEHPPLELVPEDSARRDLMQRWKDCASIIGEDPIKDLDSSAAACISVLTLPLFASGIAVIPYRHIFEGILFHRVRMRAVLFFSLKVIGLERLFRVNKFDRAMGKAKSSLLDHFAALDELLSDGRPWIVGNEFTLADVSWMVLFDRLVEADWNEHVLSGNLYPWVQAYWERLQTRPSYNEGVDAFRHPLVSVATDKIRQLKATDDTFRASFIAGCPAR